jgi:hypothetical protein
MFKIAPYKLARGFAIAFLLSFVPLIALGAIFAVKLHGGGIEVSNKDNLITSITTIMSLVAMIVSAVGTTSTVLIGWRSEHRQSEEFKIKIKQLELQLEEAKSKHSQTKGDLS